MDLKTGNVSAVKTAEWSAHELNVLIDSVKVQPVLYNNVNYSCSREVSEKLWEFIAIKIPGKTGQKCKEKWRYLKNGFTERFNSDKLVKWPYYERLMFLSPFVQNDGASTLNRSVKVIPQPSTSAISPQVMAVRIKDESQGPASKRRSPKVLLKKKQKLKKKKSSIALLFERIEKDIVRLPSHEQYDFEIQVMSIFRDKLQKCGGTL